MLERQGLVALASSMLAFTAAAEAPAKGPTVGFMHAIHATNDVSKTLEFHTDVFGLQGKIQPFVKDSNGLNLELVGTVGQ
jgi:hypothetical protein